MLLHSVIIILREVLEAALLISAMLSLSHYLKMPLSWLKWSTSLGLIGAAIYASNIVIISDWFEGVGQEVVNASLQYFIYLLLAGFCIWLIQKKPFSGKSLKIVAWVIGISICFAVIREFSEILVYLHIAILDPQHSTGIIMGAFLGAGIGLSAGVLFYHLLNYLSDKGSFITIIVVLSFIAAGMLSQATLLLIQADWLPSQQALWDSSAWVSERSVLGQLLYAVFGYEATPSPLQVGFYFTGLFIILFFVLRQYQLSRTTLIKS